MKNIISKQNRKGFTLIEILVAVFIISVGLVGISNIISQIAVYNHDLSHRLVATYLVQEGLEIVRNIRDANWLNTANGEEDWNNGINDDTCYEADFEDTSLQTPPTYQALKIADGFYKYAGTVSTPYIRIICIDNQDGETSFRVTVTVQWANGKEIEVSENLYNWYY